MDLEDKVAEAIVNLNASVVMLTDSVAAMAKVVDEMRQREFIARRKQIHAVSKELDNDG